MSDLSSRIAGLSPERQALLLQQLAARTAPAPVLALPPLVPRPADRFLPFPLTDIQEVYWAGRSGYFDLSNPGVNAYFEYQIEGRVDSFLDGFEDALRRAVDRHEILRLVVEPDGRQRFLEQVPPVRVERIDLRGESPEEVQRRLEELRGRFRYHEGPAGHWPLFGLTAHRLAEERAVLHVWMDCWLIDGLSRDRLVRDLFLLFDRPGEELEPLACSYRDYALARREHRASEIYRASRDWWLERIPTLPPPPGLPLAGPLSPRVRARFQHAFVRILEPGEWRQLKERAARRNLTPSSPVIAAFVEVVRAWSRHPRFTLSLEGSYWPPIHPQIRDLVGNFNTVYILSAEDLDGKFADRARRLQSQLSELLRHRTFSGFEVLRELRRRQGGGTRSLMPVMFNSLVEYTHPSYQDPNAPRGPDDARILQAEIGGHPPQLLLMPAVFEGGDGSLHCKVQAVDEAFPRGFVPAFREAFVQLLRRLAAEEEAWDEAHLDLNHAVQLAKRQPLFQAFPPPQATTLHALVAAQAAAHPERPAVLGAEGLTYGELLERARRLADRLRAAGAGLEAPVAMILGRGWQQAVAMLGVSISGACLLPVDPALSASRLGQLLDRYRVGLAVTSAHPKPGIDLPRGVRRVTVEESPHGGAPGAEAQVDPGAPAYLVETGDGRGVVVEHGAASRALVALGRRLGLGSADRLLPLSPPSSDLALFEILAPLAAGGAVVLPAAGKGAEACAELACDEGTTVWSGPPLLVERLLAQAEGRKPPHSLRLIVLGRDRVPVSLPERLRALAPGARVACLGGVPEAAFASTVHAVWSVPDGASGIPAGRPVAPCTAHVLDHNLTPRPDLVVGDLYLGGPTLARGYRQDEELTRSRFILHPRTGERLVRTGLLGRYLDGVLEILGTPDEHQVELFGAPAELGWIAAALERQPEVRAAAVRPWRAGERRRVAAYFVTRSGTSLEPAELARRLSASLPAHLLPACLTRLGELPLTPHGALDREALPPPGPEAEPPPSSPDAVEGEIAGLWSELLGAPPAAPTDDFFALGGDSFTAVLLLTRVRKSFGLAADLASFFLTPTLRHLAAAVRESRP